MNVSKILLNGVEYNLTDNDAQSKINEINESLTNVNESLKDYAKSEDVEANYQPKGDYLTEHQSLDNYYTKSETTSEIYNVTSWLRTQLVSKEELEEVTDEVDQKINEITSTLDTEYLSIDSFNEYIGAIAFKDYVDKAINAIEVPTKVSELENDSKYQTEAQVNAAIQKVVGAAPEALDTLEEIAEKLGDNDDVVAGIVNTLSTKADATALTEYYNKTEVDSKIADAVTGGVESIDLTVYETKEGAADKYQPKGNYLTEHQDISGKADKSEIPSLEGYATESWVEDQNYLTEHQSLADYVKKAAFVVNGETLEITFN